MLVRRAFPPAAKSLKPPLMNLFKVDMTPMASAATEIASTPLPTYIQAIVVIFAIVIGVAYWFHLCILWQQMKKGHELAKEKLKQEYIPKSIILPISIK